MISLIICTLILIIALAGTWIKSLLNQLRIAKGDNEAIKDLLKVISFQTKILDEQAKMIRIANSVENGKTG